MIDDLTRETWHNALPLNDTGVMQPHSKQTTALRVQHMLLSGQTLPTNCILNCVVFLALLAEFVARLCKVRFVKLTLGPFFLGRNLPGGAQNRTVNDVFQVPSLYRGLLSPAAGYGFLFAISFSSYGYAGRVLLRYASATLDSRLY